MLDAIEATVFVLCALDLSLISYLQIQIWNPGLKVG